MIQNVLAGIFLYLPTAPHYIPREEVERTIFLRPGEGLETRVPSAPTRDPKLLTAGLPTKTDFGFLAGARTVAGEDKRGERICRRETSRLAFRCAHRAYGANSWRAADHL